jgi:hypothetical protein
MKKVLFFVFKFLVYWRTIGGILTLLSGGWRGSLGWSILLNTLLNIAISYYIYKNEKNIT